MFRTRERYCDTGFQSSRSLRKCMNLLNIARTCHKTIRVSMSVVCATFYVSSSLLFLSTCILFSECIVQLLLATLPHTTHIYGSISPISISIWITPFFRFHHHLHTNNRMWFISYQVSLCRFHCVRFHSPVEQIKSNR